AWIAYPVAGAVTTFSLNARIVMVGRLRGGLRPVTVRAFPKGVESRRDGRGRMVSGLPASQVAVGWRRRFPGYPAAVTGRQPSAAFLPGLASGPRRQIRRPGRAPACPLVAALEFHSGRS